MKKSDSDYVIDNLEREIDYLKAKLEVHERGYRKMREAIWYIDDFQRLDPDYIKKYNDKP